LAAIRVFGCLGLIEQEVKDDQALISVKRLSGQQDYTMVVTEIVPVRSDVLGADCLGVAVQTQTEHG
jgi:hypothetical protein